VVKDLVELVISQMSLGPEGKQGVGIFEERTTDHSAWRTEYKFMKPNSEQGTKEFCIRPDPL
jgi:hypothetical protein